MRAATLKGLMSHTADECGLLPGPDHRFGWGLINATRAAQVISADFSEEDTSALIDEKSINMSTYTTNIIAQGNGTPLKVSISWTDPVHVSKINNGVDDSDEHALVNDLDLRVKMVGDEGEGELPWKLSSILSQGAQKVDNDVDNIEIVEIVAPVAGAEYEISVIPQGILQDGPQKYTLIITGMEGGVNGISENELSAGINVYPNPATGKVLAYRQHSIKTYRKSADAGLESCLSKQYVTVSIGHFFIILLISRIHFTCYARLRYNGKLLTFKHIKQCTCIIKLIPKTVLLVVFCFNNIIGHSIQSQPFMGDNIFGCQHIVPTTCS